MPHPTIPPANFSIPIIDGAANAGGYHSIPFDLNDPRAREPLVKLEDYGIACHPYASRCAAGEGKDRAMIGGMTQNLWARASVAEKLARINASLAKRNLALLVLDAYRSITAQASIWRYYENIAQKIMPNANAHERERYTLNFVSDPRAFDPENTSTWPVHACGGAIDVTLQELSSGKALDMGASFDEMSDSVISDAYERQRQARTIPENHPALVNRRLLHIAMASEGFTNYPLEYWHFDYGDQMHALHAQNLGLVDAPGAAWYGYLDSPEPLQSSC